jgi:hypothetical protein
MSKRQNMRRVRRDNFTAARVSSSLHSRMPAGCIPFGVLFGLLVFVCGAVGLGQSLFFFTHGVSTSGTVSNFWSSRTDDHFDVTFLALHGQYFTVSTSKSVGFETYQDGSVVPVLYNPSDPHEAVVDTFSALWFRQLALVLFGAAITLFYGIATYALGKRVFQQRRTSRQKDAPREVAKSEVKPRLRRRRPARINRSKLNRSRKPGEANGGEGKSEGFLEERLLALSKAK